MNAPIDTLAFADKFENAGFGHEQARALAAAFGQAQDSTREGLVTRADLDLRLTEMEGRLNRQLGELEVRLTKQIGDVGKDITGRLWSTVTIIAGVSTAISAVVGAAVALLVRSGAL